MLLQYKSFRNKIRLHEDNDEHLNVIEQSKLYLKELQIDQNTNVEEDYWFAYYTMAKARKNYLGIKDMDITIKYTKESIKYITNNNVYYMYSLWLLAECYVVNQNISKAINVYNQIIRFYKMHNMKSSRLMNIFNKAKLMNKTNSMLQLINIYKKYSDMDMKTLNSMYEELFDTYIKQSNTIKALQLLHNIPDKILSNLLYKKLLAA